MESFILVTVIHRGSTHRRFPKFITQGNQQDPHTAQRVHLGGARRRRVWTAIQRGVASSSVRRHCRYQTCSLERCGDKAKRQR